MRCDKCGNEITRFTYCEGRVEKNETIEACQGKICGSCMDNHSFEQEMLLCQGTHSNQEVFNP